MQKRVSQLPITGALLEPSKEIKTRVQNITGEVIPRSEFLAKVAMASAAIPFGAFTYGIISGAHDYRVKRLTVNLPRSRPNT